MAINFDVHGYNEQPEQENLQPEAPMGDDTWLQDQFTNKAYDNEETRNAAWAERGLDPNAYEWITDEQGNLYTEGNPVQPQVPEEQADTQVNPEPNVLVDENDLLTDIDENGSQDIIGAVDDNDLSPNEDETISTETEMEPEPEPDEEKKARKKRILRWAGSGVSLSTPNASLNDVSGETSSVRGGNIENTPSDSERTSRGMGSTSKAFHDIMSAPPVSKGQNKMTYESIGQSLSGIHSGSAPRIPDSGKPTSAKASGPTTRMFNDIIKGNTTKPMSYDKTPKGNYSIKGIPTSKKSGGQGEGGGKLGLPRVNANPRIDMIIERIIEKVKATPNHKIEKGRILIEMEDGEVLVKFGSYPKTSLDNLAKQHPKELGQVYQLCNNVKRK